MKTFFYNTLKQDRSNVLTLSLFSLLITFSLTTVDVIGEVRVHASFEHIILELLIFISSFVGVVGVAIRYLEERNLRISKGKIIDEMASELEVWKSKVQSLSTQFFQAVDDQLENWKLSKTEKDIAILIIKGASIKEIAQVRNVTEKTIRAHASSIYRKSKLSTRYELAAYFIDGLVD